jgi:tRNA-specific 2-thiouridylase
VRDYVGGRTPIPCVACNDRLKFDELVRRAAALGADRVATGHYARLDRDGDRDRGRVRLLRAADRSKDQTYFLAGLDQAQLAAAEFPLGGLEKTQVRELAREAGLAVADKPESQEICFVPDGDVAAFVEGRAPGDVRAGEMVDASGAVVGRHAGVHGFTVGQRRGLGAFGRPTYVLELRASAAEVVVGGEDALMRRLARVERFSWISGEVPPGAVEAHVQVRHGRHSARALVTPAAGGATIEFAEAQRAIAPGQQAVAYAGDECLGGGPISSAR